MSVIDELSLGDRFLTHRDVEFCIWATNHRESWIWYLQRRSLDNKVTKWLHRNWITVGPSAFVVARSHVEQKKPCTTPFHAFRQALFTGTRLDHCLAVRVLRRFESGVSLQSFGLLPDRLPGGDFAMWCSFASPIRPQRMFLFVVIAALSRSRLGFAR